MSDDKDDLIKALRTQIEELEQSIEEYEDDGDRYNEGFNDGKQESSTEVESKIEHSFYAGFNCASEDGSVTVLKGFLNYKMEQRL